MHEPGGSREPQSVKAAPPGLFPREVSFLWGGEGGPKVGGTQAIGFSCERESQPHSPMSLDRASCPSRVLLMLHFNVDRITDLGASFYLREGKGGGKGARYDIEF